MLRLVVVCVQELKPNFDKPTVALAFKNKRSSTKTLICKWHALKKNIGHKKLGVGEESRTNCSKAADVTVSYVCLFFLNVYTLPYRKQKGQMLP